METDLPGAAHDAPSLSVQGACQAKTALAKLKKAVSEGLGSLAAKLAGQPDDVTK
jgi:hypothetical protein